MKKSGIIVIVLGILLTVFSGISLKKEDTIVEVGNVELTQEKEEDVNWPQWIGVVAIAAGVIIFVVGRKK